MSESITPNASVPATTDTLANLRDVGGLHTVDGRTTRYGVLYRSDAPYQGDSRPAAVSIWPPAVVVDLRSLAETERNPFDWGQDTIRHHRPLHDGAAPTEVLPPELTGLYNQILGSAADRVAELLSIVVGASGPTLVHCAAGKDRTGVAVATLLLAAGVTPNEVVDDYLQTSAHMPALRLRWKAKANKGSTRRALPPQWLTAPESAITSVVNRLTLWPGGAGGWLVDHGASAADLAQWRAALLN
ncbi:protein tyrosine phosphatase [Rhodococcus erythropolis]|uniref:tyrosine-protein phosphatase n=1 Tax=Rhodococcus qingshengii TaxID=334542 RepID=UPI00093760BE|nr:tyrosine-protein phosphatase [Rhodococcus qingshengii]MCZ4547295.1 tyrosine-protein phosphatase [Rhodococcus qingshengii]OKA12530.1 protein tyrosine phosphatase [Rhodococcus erythropolis]REK78103.1 tyrosine-protein phosphatase [Rhodococcus erythropolis]